jgi:hypothetical protein
MMTRGIVTGALAMRLFGIALLLLTAFHVGPPALRAAAGPDAPDLTIKTRRTTDHADSSVTTEILSLKGARQRRELIVEWPDHVRPAPGAIRASASIAITQCDERRIVLLNEEARIYAFVPRAANATLMPRGRTAGPAGGEVTITINDVDTGERRAVGRYTARRIVTTTTTEPGPGAATRSSVTERDAWYLDLPAGNCSESHDLRHTSFLIGHAGDRVRIKAGRTVRLGYPIEEINRSRTYGSVFTTRLALIEYSEAPLDEDLFTVPSGYQPALRTLFGAPDMTKPDTIGNRLASYWDTLTTWVHDFLR